LHLTLGGIENSVLGEPFLASLHEIFQPGIVGTGLDTFSAAKIPDGCIPTKTFQDNTDPVFSSELAAGKALDILDELPGLFSSGFSLPEVDCCTMAYS